MAQSLCPFLMVVAFLTVAAGKPKCPDGWSYFEGSCYHVGAAGSDFSTAKNTVAITLAEDTTHIGVGPGGDFQANNGLFDNLITGDETWVHLNTPETKCDSMTWKHPSSPVTKNFKVQRSAAKVMATVFWDAKGVILLDILPQGQSINAARYCSLLTALKKQFVAKDLGS
ncbi:histone-lysine N-methyltransferase SETMAR [Plakobranchus ocellatus]|uniref:Histone-lysine N-methyltransferase SETMAR n=1 Tax=Plakobranchus ocellatus TaxID=259542 RepID=A0AAV3ZAJ9_9GAST|nr:histone-lysine N-methyltransferase SETMAR [Plakobranchus ocellatus]